MGAPGHGLVLRFADVAPGRPYHGALVTLDGDLRETVAEHAHDFWELLLVLDGRGTHLVAGRELELNAGRLVLVRPADRHALSAGSGSRLTWINIAFPAGEWLSFAAAAGLARTLDAWTDATDPPAAALAGAELADAASAFRRALRAFAGDPSGLDLCAFWSAALPLLARDPGGTGRREPAWLGPTVAAMRLPEHLRAGLPRLVELSGVTPEHVARTFRASRGETPTGFITGVRLERAAELLVSTDEDILSIAGACGFDSLSYFYRRFTARFGRPPRAYRVGSRRSVAP